jgi:hypothetical protein
MSKGFIVIDRQLANCVGPIRRHPLIVQPEESEVYAALIDTDDGVLVRFSSCRETEIIDAPMHVVADRIYSLLGRLKECLS